MDATELYLNDKQLEEMAAVNALGRPFNASLYHTQKSLLLWREANNAPWFLVDKEGGGFFHGIACKAQLGDAELARIDHYGDSAAIIHERNTVELRAALAFWCMKREACEAWCCSQSRIDRTRAECLGKIDAISAALEQI